MTTMATEANSEVQAGHCIPSSGGVVAGHAVYSIWWS